MKICEMGSTGSSSVSKGMRKDRQPNQQSAICKRQKKRNDIDDINEFMKVMPNICPEHYSKESV